MSRGAQIRAAADAVAKEYDAHVFFYSGPIIDSGYGSLIGEIGRAQKTGDASTALLILVTNGGRANTGYQIARLLQKMYSRLIVYIPSFCKSAGTLIALGAHELLMDPVSELGPLDVQLMRRDELASRKSGLLAKSAFESLGTVSFELFERFLLGIKFKSEDLISFKLASEVSASMVSNLMAPVYSQMNPDEVGSDWRDLNVAVEYGIRLVRVSRNATPRTVDHLVSNYPTHDFIIDDTEAQELFSNVSVPAESLYELVSLLGDLAYQEAPSPIVQAITANGNDDEQEEDGDDEDRSDLQAAAGNSSSQPSLDQGGTTDQPRDPEAGGKDGASGDDAGAHAAIPADERTQHLGPRNKATERRGRGMKAD